jgi:glyoxylase-like metal-dependent hydrolase (beta-lactamase superfamily II)
MVFSLPRTAREGVSSSIVAEEETMAQSGIWDLYAIRYAHHGERHAGENFIGGDPHDGKAPIDYFVWLARSEGRSIVIDTGFNKETAERRKRQFLRCPTEGLKLLGVDAKTVRDVVITHLHYDHVGNFDLFPSATYHLQDREMAFATGRYMRYPVFNGAFDPEHVVGMVRELYKGRVEFHDGDAELAPGFSIHHIGGHTAGLQSVRVKTRRGWVVVASDAAHLYANFEEKRPFPIVLNIGEMVDGWAKLLSLAESPAHVVPGHDPLVLRRYPPVRPELEGIALRLDVEPRA